jgi:hypothetical protein
MLLRPQQKTSPARNAHEWLLPVTTFVIDELSKTVADAIFGAIDNVKRATVLPIAMSVAPNNCGKFRRIEVLYHKF